jgi:hypothetical protein
MLLAVPPSLGYCCLGASSCAAGMLARLTAGWWPHFVPLQCGGRVHQSDILKRRVQVPSHPDASGNGGAVLRFTIHCILAGLRLPPAQCLAGLPLRCHQCRPGKLGSPHSMAALAAASMEPSSGGTRHCCVVWLPRCLTRCCNPLLQWEAGKQCGRCGLVRCTDARCAASPWVPVYFLDRWGALSPSAPPHLLTPQGCVILRHLFYQSHTSCVPAPLPTPESI